MHSIPVWQMVKEAIEQLGGRASRSEVINNVRARYGDINEGTISCQLGFCSVNRQSRVNDLQNQRPRIANRPHDCLFHLGGATYELYDPNKHGIWELRRNGQGKLEVGKTDSIPAPAPDAMLQEEECVEAPSAESTEDRMLVQFPVESHLRDFVAGNLSTLEVNGRRLRLYRDSAGRDGIEYPTEVGPIDILAVDEAGGLVVFELKLSRGIDAAVGQLARYVGWVTSHIADGKPVTGVVVAKHVDRKLRYAASIIPSVSLFEYDVTFSIRPAELEAAI